MAEIVIPYAPRPQMVAYHARAQRFACIVAHRRFGKTVGVLNDLQMSALTCPKPNARVAYIAPYYSQAKAVAWDYAKFYSGVIPGVKYNESEMRVDYPNGARLRLFGADNYDAMRGLYFDDVALDEPADFPPAAWPTVIRPALADREGRATFMGTPKGKNDFWEVYDKATRNPDWYVSVLRASETGILPQQELTATLHEIGPDRYDQEFECSFEAAIIGAYYGKEMRLLTEAGRIKHILPEPTLPVVTAWDLGMSDTTSIVFAQFAGQEMRIIDHIEDSGQGLQFYVKLLQDRGYIYEQHILPHDVRVRELGTGQSRIETLASLGVNNVTVCPNIPVEDGIQSVRQKLPLTWFNGPKTGRLIESLRQYQRDWDDKGKTWRSFPRHDWTSHGADSFRYLCVGYKPMSADWGKPLRRNLKGIA